MSFPTAGKAMLKLQAGPVTTIQPSLNAPANHVVSWPTRARLGYQLQTSATLANDWVNAGASVEGDGLAREVEAAVPGSGRIFYRLLYQPVAMPVSAPENAGFFLTYADFGL